MDIHKALELLAIQIQMQYSARQTDNGDAVKLGLQALLRVLEWRAGTIVNPYLKLSGETE